MLLEDGRGDQSAPPSSMREVVTRQAVSRWGTCANYTLDGARAEMWSRLMPTGWKWPPYGVNARINTLPDINKCTPF